MSRYLDQYDPNSVVPPALDHEAGAAIVFSEENYPYNIEKKHLDHLLMAAVLAGASDITIQSDEIPKIEVFGEKYFCTEGRTWNGSEVFDALSGVYGGDNLQSLILSRKIIDMSYEINRPDGERQGFRVNMTGIGGRRGHGIEATFRVLPIKTPKIDEVGISEEMFEAMNPKDGLVLFVGATGSGKSTAQAAITGKQFLSKDRPVKIVDLQAPTEFRFNDIRDKNPRSMIGQSEVGLHIDSFADGVRSALRRNPDIIIVGESRDYETIAATLEAALTGHAVYSTTHANSVPEAISRLRAAFRPEEQDVRALDLIACLRFIIVQHLIPRIDRPGRVAVREYLRMTDRIRTKLVNRPTLEWGLALNEEIDGLASDREDEDLSRSLIASAVELYTDGVISEAEALRLVRLKSASARAIMDEARGKKAEKAAVR